MTPLSARAYVAVLVATIGCGLAVVWAWVSMAPLAFLDPEYPSFRAKQQLVARCDVGSLLVVGDSRAAADILPNRLPVRATNLAVGGGGPIEAYYTVRRALSCPNPPARILLSLGIGHLAQPDTIWDRSIRFGLLDAADVADLRAVATQRGDSTIDDASPDGLPGSVRAMLYAVRFPSLYFASLLRGGVALRYAGNRAVLARTLDARGQYYFGTGPGSDAVAMEGRLQHFVPAPLLDHFLDLTLTLAERHAIPVDFVAMPLNQATWARTKPGIRQSVAAYLDGMAARHPGFRVVSDVMPHWPDVFFGDHFAHLNPRGATLLSSRLAECLHSDTGMSECNLSWDQSLASATR